MKEDFNNCFDWIDLFLQICSIQCRHIVCNVYYEIIEYVLLYYKVSYSYSLRHNRQATKLSVQCDLYLNALITHSWKIILKVLYLSFRYYIRPKTIWVLIQPWDLVHLPKWQSILNLQITIRMYLLLETVSWLDSQEWTRTRIVAWTLPCAVGPRSRIAL